jgi:serine/tyrosine/threonine adenylyltransferase
MWQFDNSYFRELPGFYTSWKGSAVANPRIAILNHNLADAIGLDRTALPPENLARILVGEEAPIGSAPLAQAYAGHQFGQFNPKLGDGRALLLGEVLDHDGRRVDIQLKGSGRTPFSRGGDGKAALGPMLREYIIGEALHALGIPSTRALSVVTTGEDVLREKPLPGAVLARIAASHIRVGTFQYFAALGDHAKLRHLADYTIARHYPEARENSNPYSAFLQAVVDAQADLMARWMGVGFVHGVMNTDNMAISGESIDFGPCAFLDIYSANAVFSSIDHGGRYAFGNQPGIAAWNLARFAECLLSLIDDDAQKAVDAATAVLASFEDRFLTSWLAVMRNKLGLLTSHGDDIQLVKNLFQAMEGQQVDYTQFFRALGTETAERQGDDARACFLNPTAFNTWHLSWRARQAKEPDDPVSRAKTMNAANPIYIPRNHKVEEALAAANDGNLQPLNPLLVAVTSPFKDLGPAFRSYAEPGPNTPERYVTFCGT